MQNLLSHLDLVLRKMPMNEIKSISQITIYKILKYFSPLNIILAIIFLSCRDTSYTNMPICTTPFKENVTLLVLKWHPQILAESLFVLLPATANSTSEQY